MAPRREIRSGAIKYGVLVSFKVGSRNRTSETSLSLLVVLRTTAAAAGGFSAGVGHFGGIEPGLHEIYQNPDSPKT